MTVQVHRMCGGGLVVDDDADGGVGVGSRSMTPKVIICCSTGQSSCTYVSGVSWCFSVGRLS
jgi:hypothetical protein